MAEDIATRVKAEIAQAEKDLAEAKGLMDKLRLAGEDVKAQEADYRKTKLRVDRWKTAFK